MGHSKRILFGMLVSDHIGFYERYGWEFLCIVNGESDMIRMYIHK
ncbi:hypothetical protein [Helicobacter sp. MIT 11-5569]|nr:hypothetical protein [Helicobacter sp. MIT 11-5569]